ncbi:UrcA family protein [Caulobacter sp. DWR1-3-2b1]|uniref:UrcA family protein n=1 Tax=Caulobacter sp. DWR1-3-2b1 TaxID=2804670 RepID=UPI003CF3126E
MRKFIMSLTTVASLSLAAIPVLGLTQAAHAGEPQARIAFGDLNLSNPAQAAVFKARLGAAADTLCSAKARTNDLNMSFNDCRVSVEREARRQLSNTQRKALQVAARAAPVEMAAR